MTDPTGKKTLFDHSTAWKRMLMRYVGVNVWSGLGAIDEADHQPIPDVSFSYEGGKAAVLLIHGLTGTPTEMKFVGKGLANAGFSVYGMQMAGHCGSEEDLLRTNWQDWYASVQAAYEQVAAKHEVVFAAGLSMGAVMSMHLAAQNPGKLRGIGLISTTLRYDGWSIPKLSFLLPLICKTPLIRHYRFVENFPYGIKDDRLRHRVVTNMLSGDSTESGTLGMPGPSLAQLMRLVEVVMAEMPRVTTPAVILHASEDDVASRWNADYCEAHLGGPTKKVLYDQSYHLLTVDKERNAVVAELAKHFAGLCDPADLNA